jgi:RHS repeat-associated protein
MFRWPRSSGKAISSPVLAAPDSRRIKTIEGANQTVYSHLPGSWDPIYVSSSVTGVTKIVFAGALRIGEVRSNVSRCDHLDRLGSVRLVTNDAIGQTFAARYKPFGMGYATSGAQLFTFTGKQFQHSVNLYYLGYRYLDPKLGRFVQMDPLLNQNPRDPQTANRYAYAKNNPLRFSDPDGRMAFILEGGYLLTPKSAGGVQGKLAAAVGASLEATGPTKPSALPSDRDDHTETTVTTVRTSTFSVPPDYTSESSGPSAETIVHCFYCGDRD